jgi:F0F1-type ATP synthase membrane subunit b/b'
MKRPWTIAVAMLALATCAAIAAEPHAEHAAHEAASISSLFLPLLNFALFVALFWYFAWPVVRAALIDRRQLVQKELAEADAVHRAAEAALEEIRARRAGVQQEGTRLVAELRAQAEHDRQRLIESARQTAQRIGKDAQLLAEQEAKRAAHAIREEIAAQVVARVTDELRKRLSAEDERRFVGEFVAAVERGDMR